MVQNRQCAFPQIRLTITFSRRVLAQRIVKAFLLQRPVQKRGLQRFDSRQEALEEYIRGIDPSGTRLDGRLRVCSRPETVQRTAGILLRDASVPVELTILVIREVAGPSLQAFPFPNRFIERQMLEPSYRVTVGERLERPELGDRLTCFANLTADALSFLHGQSRQGLRGRL